MTYIGGSSISVVSFVAFLLIQFQAKGGFEDETSTEARVRLVPEMEHEKLSIDFGSFVANEKVVRKITIENVTAQPLTPERVKTSCGCIVANLPIVPIPRGKLTSFDVTLQATTGDFRKTMEISFRELPRPIVIDLKGTAKNRFSITPHTVSLSAKKTAAVVELAPEFNDTLKDVSCRSTGELVTIETTESLTGVTG
jgi:hypothetical protein